MTILTFFLFVIIVLVIAGFTVMILDIVVPERPDMTDRLVWGVALLVIFYQLLGALGLLGHSPMIPHL